MFKKIKGIFSSSYKRENSPAYNKQYIELTKFKKASITGVEIVSQRDGKVCKPCLDADGKEYTLDEAFKLMPLPHKNCENDSCRCNYFPIID